jgi:hypothetical protein
MKLGSRDPFTHSANGLPVRIACADHDVKADPIRCLRRKRSQCHSRVVRWVGAAHGYQNPPQLTGAPRERAEPMLFELPSHQGVLGAEQQTSGGRQQTSIRAVQRAIEILIQQQVAIVRAVRQIVDHQDMPRLATKHRFPATIQRVMINNQPLRHESRALKGFPGLCGILLPARVNGRGRRVVRSIIGIRKVQTENDKSASRNRLAHVTVADTGHERYRSTVTAKFLRESEASHDVPAAKCDGRVAAKNDIHGDNQFRRLNRSWQTGPSSRSSTLRPDSHSLMSANKGSSASKYWSTTGCVCSVHTYTSVVARKPFFSIS